MTYTLVMNQETVDGVRVISFGPEMRSITEDVIAEVTEHLLQASQSDPPLLVIDMSHVDFFSSSFIEVLFQAWNQVKSREGGRFALCCLHPYCREILTITNLHTVWDLHETREEAVAAVTAGGQGG
jgi:anti-anti-sigma factor